MVIEKVAFEIPKYIAKGLSNGTFVRHGGVVRNAVTGAVVKMLKEVPVVEPKACHSIAKQIIIPIAGAIATVGAVVINNRKNDIDNFITSKFKKNKKETFYENITDFKAAKNDILKSKKA